MDTGITQPHKWGIYGISACWSLEIQSQANIFLPVGIDSLIRVGEQQSSLPTASLSQEQVNYNASPCRGSIWCFLVCSAYSHPQLALRSYTKLSSPAPDLDWKVSPTKRWLAARGNRRETVPKNRIIVKYSPSSDTSHKGR